MAENGIITFLKRLTSPNAPSVGKVSLYAKDDDNLYLQDSNGNENEIIHAGNLGITQDYVPDWQVLSGTPPSYGNAALVSNFTKIGNFCLININLTMGSTTTFGSNDWYFGYPDGISPNGVSVGHVYIFDYGTRLYTAGVITQGAGMLIYFSASGANYAKYNYPHVWAVNDRLWFSIAFPTL